MLGKFLILKISEADLVAVLVEELKEAHVTDDEIGIITPYNAQCSLLRKRLQGIAKAEISTVDGFQVLIRIN